MDLIDFFKAVGVLVTIFYGYQKWQQSRKKLSMKLTYLANESVYQLIIKNLGIKISIDNPEVRIKDEDYGKWFPLVTELPIILDPQMQYSTIKIDAYRTFFQNNSSKFFQIRFKQSRNKFHGTDYIPIRSVNAKLRPFKIIIFPFESLDSSGDDIKFSRALELRYIELKDTYNLAISIFPFETRKSRNDVKEMKKMVNGLEADMVLDGRYYGKSENSSSITLSYALLNDKYDWKKAEIPKEWGPHNVYLSELMKLQNGELTGSIDHVIYYVELKRAYSQKIYEHGLMICNLGLELAINRIFGRLN